MSRFGKLIGWLRGGRDENPGPMEPLAIEISERHEPAVLTSPDEAWLEALAAAAGEGERLDDIGSVQFWKRIDAIWGRGDERLAAEWVEKMIDVPLTPAEVGGGLRLRLVEMFEDRADLGPVLDHLRDLADEPEHTVRANYLLGEHFRRRGDEAGALRHYEAVLARDVDYPNVRIRVERLRRRQGQSNRAALGATIVGPEAHGGGAGARYRLVRELGRGATGVVYLARDVELERDVAIKLLHPHLSAAERADHCARFFAEARVAASLRHPNIMAILDLDERARRIVLEVAAGRTLRDVLRERGPRPLRRALERHAQILSALGAAHRRGIVHRDLKPANLMFRRDPDEPGAEIVLGDFGVAHLPGADADPEKSGDAVGTLAYMAPEQRRAEAVRPAWDLYAAAVVLFEMLTGRPAWTRDVLLAGIRRRGDFSLPAEVTAGASAELTRLLQEHLDDLGDPDPSVRPDTPTALEAARLLRDLALTESAA